MLPSEGFKSPKKFSIVFKKEMAGVADTAGPCVHVAAKPAGADVRAMENSRRSGSSLHRGAGAPVETVGRETPSVDREAPSVGEGWSGAGCPIGGGAGRIREGELQVRSDFRRILKAGELVPSAELIGPSPVIAV